MPWIVGAENVLFRVMLEFCCAFSYFCYLPTL